MQTIVWTNDELSKALGIPINFNLRSGKVEFNSQDIKPGDIFIALPGEKRDGHEFIEDALTKGATAVISSKTFDHDRIILVKDTTAALLNLAKYKREKSTAKFLGVTGSVGKTSTKEALGTILSTFAPTYCNVGSFNNHIGVPLTLASLPLDTEFSVNEMGMNHAGEISILSKQVRPHIAIITRIGEAHLENLGTVENICKAKCEIFDGLEPGGSAIINFDSPYFDLQRKILAERKIENVYTFGESSNADCYITEYIRNDEFAEVTYSIYGKLYKTTNYLIGKHQAVNIGAALMSAHILGLDLEKAAYQVQNIKQYGGRGLEISLEVEGKKIHLIDDAYNANPTSLGAALDDLRYRKGNKIAVFSYMVELGPDSAKYHKGLAEKVRNSGVSKLFTFSDLMKNLHNEVSNEINSFHYDEPLNKNFEDIIKNIYSDATILVKGSKSSLIRNFVHYLTEKYSKK